MKGIVLAGGAGSRLFPATKGISKQLMPIYDKPMIYYPLSLLMLAKIRDILLITTKDDQYYFKKLLGDGSQWGLDISYVTQYSPDGIAHAFLLAEDFLQNEDVCLILGDNVFYGHGLTERLTSAKRCIEELRGGCVFSYKVKDPHRYGVVEFNEYNQVVSIEEKPTVPKSHFAITGLYFYDNKACDYAKTLKPSKRGELEITDLNAIYLENQQLQVQLLGRGFAWLDTGTHESLIDAASFVSSIEKRQGTKIGCIEEIVFNNGWISKEQLKDLAKTMIKTDYGQYLMDVANQRESSKHPSFANTIYSSQCPPLANGIQS
jgi:glucose-1-phosphate thymidylyltransferase